ncbi:MAG: NAD-dependent deacylase [Balneolales bacterium]|nr:NAD-dependent deacylase [Balneolales bacterium]
MPNNIKTVVVLTGAGISAESGLKTFRDSGGLWEGVDVMEVASIEGWIKNKSKVLDFYNDRRLQASKALPNAGHFALVELEDYFDVTVVTQNVDDLHEKAGSSKVLHLHGKLNEARSTGDENLVYQMDAKPIAIGDLCDKGFQLRPNIVWFGEAVPAIVEAKDIMAQADYCIIIGTSLVVYPAASLIYDLVPGTPVWLVDPGDTAPEHRRFLKNHIKMNAGTGVLKVVNELIKNYVK